MANCNNLFLEFDERIRLPASTLKSLRSSRDSLRENVKEKFKGKEYSLRFFWQGSFAMGTIISPKDNDFDVDDGIYIISESKPEESIPTLHRWVFEASESHTSIPPTDKNVCIRVNFKDGHHVDLVLYHFDEIDHPYLAHKRDGWIVSDPKEFMDWFSSMVDDDGQLRRIVRYFKAWADELRGDMLSGLIFTILASNAFTPGDRDDEVFLQTMKNINTSINTSFQCYRPTVPYEDLLSDYSETRRTYIFERLNSFIQSGEQAIAEVNQKDACLKWKRHFGDRFPCELAEDSLDDAKIHESPAFIKTDARSA